MVSQATEHMRGPIHNSLTRAIEENGWALNCATWDFIAEFHNITADSQPDEWAAALKVMAQQYGLSTEALYLESAPIVCIYHANCIDGAAAAAAAR